MSSHGPSLAQVAVTQNDATSLQYQLAKSHFYSRAKNLYFAGASFTLALALAAPLVLLFRPGLGPTLGAIAGAWIFVARLALEPFRRDYQLKGATVQECFDCRVLDLPWNEALARGLPDEEIHAASQRAQRGPRIASARARARIAKKRLEQARDWYAADGFTLDWPMSVLICQRSNAVWACRQHRTYGRFLSAAAIAWFIVGVVVALADRASLGEYLVTILLPSLPAFLDASELARAHAAAARDRELIRNQMDALLEAGAAEPTDMREIQDQLFRLRRDAPQVPNWFYQFIRSGYEEDMKYAVAQLTKRLNGGAGQ